MSVFDQVLQFLLMMKNSYSSICNANYNCVRERGFFLRLVIFVLKLKNLINFGYLNIWIINVLWCIQSTRHDRLLVSYAWTKLNENWYISADRTIYNSNICLSHRKWHTCTIADDSKFYRSMTLNQIKRIFLSHKLCTYLDYKRNDNYMKNKVDERLHRIV